MKPYRQNLDQLIKAHPDYNRSSLSLAAGKSRGWLQSVIKDGKSPSMDEMLTVADLLGVTLDQIVSTNSAELSLTRAGRSSSLKDRMAERIMSDLATSALRRLLACGTRPTIDDMMCWWRRNDRRLIDYDRIEHHFDLFKIPDPDSKILKPKTLGQNSLASATLETNQPGRLFQFFESLPRDRRSSIVRSYADATRGESLTTHTIIVDLPDMAKPVSFDYCRLLLPVRDAQGGEYILNYSVPIELHRTQ